MIFQREADDGADFFKRVTVKAAACHSCRTETDSACDERFFRIVRDRVFIRCNADFIKNVFSDFSGQTERTEVDKHKVVIDNHLVLVDLRSLGLTGKVAEHVLDEIGITSNKNAIPYDPEKPFVTSGIRLGTAAVTSRGFDGDALEEVGAIIGLALKNHEDEAKLEEARQRVSALTEKFPLYKELDY